MPVPDFSKYNFRHVCRWAWPLVKACLFISSNSSYSVFNIMSGCLDKISCECDCCDCEPFKEWLRARRNMFASVISGTLVRSFTY